MKLFFATSNEGKLAEARAVLNNYEIEGTPLEIDEIQSLDTTKVATSKALMYYEKLKKMLFVEDVALIFNALGGLPGTYINDFSKAINNVGLVKLLDKYDDKSAIAITTIALASGKGDVSIFKGEVKGEIVNPRGTNGFGWDPIFVPENSNKTFAEMEISEMLPFKMRTIALLKMRDYLERI